MNKEFVDVVHVLLRYVLPILRRLVRWLFFRWLDRQWGKRPRNEETAWEHCGPNCGAHIKGAEN
jgi:hypothetical protein